MNAVGTFLERYHHATVPKVWEIGAIASMAERAWWALMEDVEGTELGVQMARIFGEQFTGFTPSNAIPQAFRPIVEVYMANRDSFTGREIEDQGMQSRLPFDRSSPYGSPTMRALGDATAGLPKALQVSPAKAEALMEGYFNSWFTGGLMVADGVLFGKWPDEPPVASAFYRTRERRNRFQQELFDMSRELSALVSTVRDLRKTGRLELARELVDGHPELRMWPAVRNADTTLNDLRDKMRSIRNARIPWEEKRRQIDALTLRGNQLAAEVMPQVRRARRRINDQEEAR